MWLIFALVAAGLTSGLPIIKKRLLIDMPFLVVAWGVNALSMPLLGLLAVLLARVPRVDLVFWLGIALSAGLNLLASLVSAWALKWEDASLVVPVLTFNPAFTLLVALATLGEVPTMSGLLGVLVIVAGSYLLNLEQRGAGWWRPLTALVTQRAMLLAAGASLLWGLTPIAEKMAIQHSQPADPPLVALGSTALMTVLLTPFMWRQVKHPLGYLSARRHGVATAALIAS
jgi:drug/metabolite transporter (DMT)-like permease